MDATLLLPSQCELAQFVSADSNEQERNELLNCLKKKLDTNVISSKEQLRKIYWSEKALVAAVLHRADGDLGATVSFR